MFPSRAGKLFCLFANVVMKRRKFSQKIGSFQIIFNYLILNCFQWTKTLQTFQQARIIFIFPIRFLLGLILTLRAFLNCERAIFLTQCLVFSHEKLIRLMKVIRATDTFVRTCVTAEWAVMPFPCRSSWLCN